MIFVIYLLVDKTKLQKDELHIYLINKKINYFGAKTIRKILKNKKWLTSYTAVL